MTALLAVADPEFLLPAYITSFPINRDSQRTLGLIINGTDKNMILPDNRSRRAGAGHGCYQATFLVLSNSTGRFLASAEPL